MGGRAEGPGEAETPWKQAASGWRLGHVLREGWQSATWRINGLQPNSPVPFKRPANQLAFPFCSIYAPAHAPSVLCILFSFWPILMSFSESEF